MDVVAANERLKAIDVDPVGTYRRKAAEEAAKAADEAARENDANYAAKKNAYNSASVSNATITLGRSDDSTGTTLTVNNVANASTAEYAKDAGKLGGVDASKYATKEDIPVIPSNLDVANRL